ncbi:MAG TPA: hypothetical protein VNO52_09080 [Methylomirabilota bacterium]|nr:hypothetical protein [Methylomirabilota bacterium]
MPLTLVLNLNAATFSEDFSSEPLARGWRVFGDASLFGWSAAERALAVTWDSGRSNSYFFQPLGTVLTKADDFSLAFDLWLEDIAIGTTPGKPYTFQIALGFVGLRSVTATNFFRAAGVHPAHGPRNVVEFDYFPDSGYGATVAPTVISTNNRFRFSDNHPLEMAPGHRYHVEMMYTARDQTLRTTMTRDGAPFGLPPSQTLRALSLGAGGGLAEFPDFRVDAFAVCSYSDEGQGDPEFSGSILAHGFVDNIRFTVPEPPLRAVSGGFADGAWQVTFVGRSNWVYVLERTVDFVSWQPIATNRPTAAGTVALLDPVGGGSAVFYRIAAARP